jgi:hypothetical protein
VASVPRLWGDIPQGLVHARVLAEGAAEGQTERVGIETVEPEFVRVAVAWMERADKPEEPLASRSVAASSQLRTVALVDEGGSRLEHTMQ